MSRLGRASVATTAVMVIGLAGCGLPAGVDGDLVSDWVAMPEPVTMVPDAGVCHNSEYKQTVQLRLLYRPVDCDEPHRLETVYVGEFEDEFADRITPPEPQTSAWQATYRECDRQAADYLGNNFRHGQLWLGVAVPTEDAWQGGARWFRCELVDTVGQFGIPAQLGSRQGILGDRADPRQQGCFVVTSTPDPDGPSYDVIQREPVACDEPHQAEFVGVWYVEQPSYPSSDSEWSRVHRGCREQVAAYVGVPVDRDLPYRTGTIIGSISDTDWANGDRGFRCYLWLGETELTESLAGAGQRGLPIR